MIEKNGKKINDEQMCLEQLDRGIICSELQFDGLSEVFFLSYINSNCFSYTFF